MRERIDEIAAEFRTVVLRRTGVLDVVLPPVLFLVVNAVAGAELAIGSALGAAGLVAAMRLLRRQPLYYALGGVLGVGIAFLAARLSGTETSFFVPGVVGTSAAALLCLASLVVRRPLVAWTSHLARRWPLAWYWHARVRPAYAEVTLAWGLYFLARLGLQLVFLSNADIAALAWFNVVGGWPATVVLLAASYLYGTRRLRSLGGPSVDEFLRAAAPPWTGQRRGF